MIDILLKNLIEDHEKEINDPGFSIFEFKRNNGFRSNLKLFWSETKEQFVWLYCIATGIKIYLRLENSDMVWQPSLSPNQSDENLKLNYSRVGSIDSNLFDEMDHVATTLSGWLERPELKDNIFGIIEIVK